MSIYQPFGFLAEAAEAEETNPTLTNLEFWVDSDRSDSYSGTGTTWSDISPSGSTKDFTLYNSPSYTAGPGGYFDFNGTSQYAAYNPGGGGYYWWPDDESDFTFEYVFAADSFSGDPCLFSQWGSVSGDESWLHLLATNSGNSVRHIWRDPATSFYFAGGLSTGTFAHVVLTYEFAGSSQYTITGYLNGSQSGQSTWTYNTLGRNSLADTQIAARARTSSRLFYDGKVGVIRYYSKALDTSEITENYNYEDAKYSF